MILHTNTIHIPYLLTYVQALHTSRTQQRMRDECITFETVRKGLRTSDVKCDLTIDNGKGAEGEGL